MPSNFHLNRLHFGRVGKEMLSSISDLEIKLFTIHMFQLKLLAQFVNLYLESHSLL